MYILADFSSSQTKVKPHYRNGQLVRSHFRKNFPYSDEFIRKRSNQETKNEAIGLAAMLGLGVGGAAAVYPLTKNLGRGRFDRAGLSFLMLYPGGVVGNKLGEYLQSREYRKHKKFYKDSQNLPPQVYEPSWKPVEKMTPQELRQTKYGRYTTNEWLTGSIL